MMPVWLLAHRQGARVVYTAVNGQSGQVVCDVPVSNGRIVGVTAVLAVVLFAVLQMFLTMRPEILMALCAILGLGIQYLFSGAQKRLAIRRNRSFEPHYGQENEADFVGPAQAMLKRTKDGIAVKMGAASGMGAQFRAVASAMGYTAMALSFLVRPQIITRAGTSAERMSLVKLIMGAALLVMIIHTVRRFAQKDGGLKWPRLLSVLAVGAGFAAMMMGQVEDLVYYGCAAAMLISCGIELAIMNRDHNEYASRPVPYFDGKEEET